MAASDHSGLMTRREGWRFAGTLAGGFAALALLALWRHRTPAAMAFGALAAVSLLAGILVPTRLRPVERLWMSIGHALSRVTSPIFFTALYLVVLTPLGFLRRSFGRSPLARSRASASFWMRRPAQTDDQLRAGLEHLY
jgi:hypothetical protein